MKKKFKIYKNQKRDALTNKIIGNKEVIEVSNAIDYVKKQGFLVLRPSDYSLGKLMIILIGVIVVFSFVVAIVKADIYEDCNIYGNCVNKTFSTSSNINFTNVNVNDSQFLQGYTPQALNSTFIQPELNQLNNKFCYANGTNIFGQSCLRATLIGNTPNKNGFNITNGNITLQPASINFGGILTNTTQSISGTKTLFGTLNIQKGKINVGGNDAADNGFLDLFDGTNALFLELFANDGTFTSLTNYYGYTVLDEFSSPVFSAINTGDVFLAGKLFIGSGFGVSFQSTPSRFVFDLPIETAYISSDGSAGLTDLTLVGQFKDGILTDNTTTSHSFTGNLDITGNLTANNIYAEMWFHNDSVLNATAISTSGVFFNVTALKGGQNLNNRKLNGFTFSNGALTPSINGKYKVDYCISGNGGINDKYHFAVAVNDSIQFNTEQHIKLGTSGDIVSICGTGFIDLTTSQHITLMIKDETATASFNVNSVNLNVLRVGSIT